MFAGCFALPYEAPALSPPYVAQPSPREFFAVPVARGDIKLEANPIAIYRPARIEIQRFPINGVLVQGIYVTFGDEVLEGDIIASLYAPEIQSEFDELSDRYARLNMELDLLIQRRELTRRLAEESGEPVNDTLFTAPVANLRSELDLLQVLLAHVGSLNEGRYLRATMDGRVSNVASFSEGMRTDSRVAIAVISDQAFSSFVVQGDEVELMNVGDRFEMTLDDEVFLMEVIDPDEFGFIRELVVREEDEDGPTEAFLAFADALPRQGSTARGMLHIPLDQVIDVLYIPVSSLHRYEGRNFVYVLEDGVRTVRDVVPGFEGEGHIEIISGLSEGELIIQ